MTAKPSAVRVTGAYFVYAELKRRVLSLELEPGQRLYEPALTKELEVSRTPLREAVRRLISENLLEQQPTGGVVVPQLDRRAIVELYNVRAAIEGLMASEATARATAADIEAMEGIVARNAALVGFAEDAMNLGTRLHETIAETADNTWAIRLHTQVSDQIQRYRPVTNKTQLRREAALAEHRAIVAAIAAGNAAVASQTAYEHVVAARDEALRAVPSEAPPAAGR